MGTFVEKEKIHMTIYVKIEGIDGNVTAKGHEKWIEVHNINFDNGRRITSAKPGHQSNREASTPSFSEVTLSKDMDETSPRIFTESCVGASKKIEIHLCRTGENIESFMEYILTDALISSYAVNASSLGHPSEQLSINFSKVEMKYTPYDDENKPGTPVPAGYDLVEASKL